MTPAPEREWTVEAHLRGTTFGTEAQAHATAERWRQLVATSAQRDVELLDVVVRGPDGHQTDECRAVVFHGPGHQSRTSCEEVDPHELHEARLVVAGHTVFWRGQEAVTGPFDESPLDEDDPYTHVESRGYFVVCCRSCDDGRPTPQPFSTAWERMAWYRAHAEGTGHEDFFVLDPTGETPSPDRLGSWVGTVAYEGVETTDGRVIEALRWPRLALGSLPVIELGTGRLVGTITEVWREELDPGELVGLEHEAARPAPSARRIRARGTVLRSVVGPDERVPLGVDVTGGDVHSDGNRVVLWGGKLTGLTLYLNSKSTPTWPDAALQLEEQETAR